MITESHSALSSADEKGLTENSRYRVLSLLGSGGLSAVYLARDEELSRDVALKVTRGPEGTSEWARTRLWFEAEITAGLEHPGVVPVYGRKFGRSGNPYFTMRCVRGETFADVSDKYHATLSVSDRGGVLRRLIDRLVDVCYTVNFANDQGVIHRDLTPRNIMLGCHGETVVVDWGLARLLNGSEDGPWGMANSEGPSPRAGLSRTRLGKSIGTPRYMSPEQAEGDWDRLGATTDVFGLGATLYRLLTGRAPFDHEDSSVSQDKATRVDCPAPRRVNRKIPAALEAVCLKAMMVEPEARYPSAIAMGDDLARWVAGERISLSLVATRREWERKTGR